MFAILSALAVRFRVLFDRVTNRLGLREETFLLPLAVLIGVVTAGAAVGFHQLINWTRDLLYERPGGDFLYGSGLPLLILWPALGGLAVGLISRYVVRAREGHGIVDVIESVVRTSGFQRPSVAIEKIVTSGITIGTGGSCGAEGPIVQIGAAIASGVGSVFRIARHHMPVLIGCGSAAGISAIFNSPIGGVLFTIEVILQDFSIRTFTPLVVASVIANVTTRALMSHIPGHHEYFAIFRMPPQTGLGESILDWPQVVNFVLLGIFCGLTGALLTRLMARVEMIFHRMPKLGAFKPALGGMLIGVLGIAYVLIFGRLMLHQAKPFNFSSYPMPAFFGDGYGVIQRLLSVDFYQEHSVGKLLLLLAFLTLVKILATCLTLGSGGSGGVIAPSLFAGASLGGLLGILFRQTGWFASIHPEIYALVGMGAVLAAVVHAPIASILILFELTQDYRVTVPAMLATVCAASVARLVHRDSIYTQSLRLRGIRPASDAIDLRRLTVEQVNLEPASVLQAAEPFQRALDLTTQLGTVNFVVIDKDGKYLGMVTAEDINTALLQREAVPLLVVGELMRRDVPIANSTDNLTTVLDLFNRFEISHLPVCIESAPGKVIGLISRAGVMKRCQDGA